MKVLMVGLGSIGQRHMRNLLTILGEEAEFIAYRVRKNDTVITETLSVEEGVTLDKKYSFVSFGDLQEALNQGPQAVFICNPSSLHMPVALEAARNGCHLFIEKPLSHNLEGIDELASLVKQNNLVTFVGFQLRFHPCFIKLKKLLAEERIGNLLAVHMEVGEYLPAWHKWEDYQGMYASRRELGGGVVLTQIHEIDYAIDLFGCPRSVYAIGGHYSSLELDVEDTANVIMECPHKNRTLPVFLHMDYIQRPPSRKCRVIGEKGAITMDFHALSVSTVYNSGEEELYKIDDFDRNRLFLDELTHFLACIDGKEVSLVDVKKARSGMAVAIAIKKSMENGEKVII